MRTDLKSLVGQLRADSPGMLWPASFPFILFSTHNNCFFEVNETVDVTSPIGGTSAKVRKTIAIMVTSCCHQS